MILVELVPDGSLTPPPVAGIIEAELLEFEFELDDELLEGLALPPSGTSLTLSAATKSWPEVLSTAVRINLEVLSRTKIPRDLQSDHCPAVPGLPLANNS